MNMQFFFVKIENYKYRSVKYAMNNLTSNSVRITKIMKKTYTVYEY